MQPVSARLARGSAVLACAALITAGLGVSPALAAGPATTVTPATGADPAGATLRVVGSGFDPDKNNGFGVYVAFGPKTPDFSTNPNVYQATKWVHKNAGGSPSQAKMNPDGSFDISFAGIKAQYTDGDGKAVNCLTTQCYIITFAAHGSPDRSQDTFSPVTFVGGENPGGPGPGEPPGGATDKQTVTTKVKQGGALTMSVAGKNVSLAEAPSGGHSTGALNKATVTDARGSNAGWSLVGQVSDFTATDGGAIPAANLAWAPNAAVVDDGSQGSVTAGPRIKGLDVARTLASSAAGASGGVFETGAGLDLFIPAGASPGSYTGTLTLTLS